MSSLANIVVEESRLVNPIPVGISPRLEKLSGVNTVLFDVYGTLFVSGSGDIGVAAAASNDLALAHSFAAAMSVDLPEGAAKVGVELLHEEVVAEHRRLKQRGIEFPEVDIREIWTAVFARLVETYRSIPVPGEEKICNIALRYELAVNPVWAMPGCRNVIDELAKRGVVLGIVSNAQFYTPLLFEALLGASVDELGFDAELCVWSYLHRHGKPSSELFEVAGRMLAERGVGPEQIAFVGNDMLNDMLIPAELGWRTILFAGDARSLRKRGDHPQCVDLRPDAIVTDLRQIVSLYT